MVRRRLILTALWGRRLLWGARVLVCQSSALEPDAGARLRPPQVSAVLVLEPVGGLLLPASAAQQVVSVVFRLALVGVL